MHEVYLAKFSISALKIRRRGCCMQGCPTGQKKFRFRSGDGSSGSDSERRASSVVCLSRNDVLDSSIPAHPEMHATSMHKESTLMNIRVIALLLTKQESESGRVKTYESYSFTTILLTFIFGYIILFFSVIQ